MDLGAGAMSVRVMTAVWERSRASGTDRLVLLAIADHAHDDGRGAYPSQALLARKTRLTERTIRSCVARLESSGELAVIRRSGRPSAYEVRVAAETPEGSSGVTGEGSSGVDARTPEEFSGDPGRGFRPPRKDLPGTPEAGFRGTVRNRQGNRQGNRQEPPRAAGGRSSRAAPRAVRPARGGVPDRAAEILARAAELEGAGA